MINGLFDFINSSPTAYQAVDTIASALKEEGFTELSEADRWILERGGRYFVTRNSSSIIAFKICPDIEGCSFRIAASHCDSPSFKLKENSTVSVRNKYITLDTEGYGGMICYSWMDRPLSLAGRVIVKEDGGLVQKLVNIKQPMALIPSLAIHMNRKVNEGVEFNKQIDMQPLWGEDGEDTPKVEEVLAAELGINAEDILGKDIFLYNCDEPKVWGVNGEYISAPRLDDLMCAYTSLRGFLACEEENCGNTISVYACFDNEEVGSSTRQGAGSSFLEDVLERIGDGIGADAQDFKRAVAGSLMLSEDNGHALHPNHPEKSDAVNQVYMNKGIVVKSQAAQKYASDGFGIALCRDISRISGVPVQFYSNRSDEAGGSTLGNIAACRIPIKTVDIGLAQLAMHSAYETAGKLDVEYMADFTKTFYEY